MERYPANGKLLKAYGRFLEFVKDDPWSAARYYAESSKLGTEESLLSIAVSSSDGDIQTKLNAAFGTINEQVGGRTASCWACLSSQIPAWLIHIVSDEMIEYQASVFTVSCSRMA